ncbi:MAG: hypothetical protein US57_C0014G0016 [Candidatus Moranbacteria bacterium GW2011_GWC2_37_73]|nr:MAG: hypothetical protein UR95_C0002G0036 [Parcubacteria group bacterium GW2011_GWC1_36_108]KKQ39393.1 MAG: hypothetical protein US57_C0014G0016 [Candidatus Moranbacteria bacterium GW2011_GWC2_37_73]HAS00070.1 hypothetical protein [Candidatus Moranbacteria bacterium]HBI50705.1 hypothetical protein [Candidatus Moranbacteria bacterium]HBU10778.1 hypothetical protein [Candidatus Moranbacteria bacterium]
MEKIHAFLIAVMVLVVGAILVVALAVNNSSKEKQLFSVVGSGTIYAKADIANINVGLKTGVKKTAVEASQESSAKMNSIIGELKKLSIDEKDIKTNDYRLNPVYNWTENKGQELTGYEVTQTLSLKIRDMEKIGEVIAKTTEQGANQIGDVAFTIDDEFALKNQAREMAIEKAKEKAAIIAKQSGMKLGKVKNVSENYDQPSFPMYANAKADAATASNQEAPAPIIQTGQNEIRVEVTLTYEVK